jgi:hypothetical protein
MLSGDFSKSQIWQDIRKCAVKLSQAAMLFVSKGIITFKLKTATQPCMPDIPIYIDDDEVIVRVIFEPYHEKKGKLKATAFRSPMGIDEVSVMRHTYMGTPFCKRKAKEIEADSRKKDPQKKYLGFAVLMASQIRFVKSNVIDSRNQFIGHADIKHGFVLQRDEPLDPKAKMELDERLKTLVSLTNYFPDPNPDEEKWSGSELTPKNG